MVAEQLLDGADAVAVVEPVGGEGVAKGATGGVLGEAGALRRRPHRALHGRIVQVMRERRACAAVSAPAQGL